MQTQTKAQSQPTKHLVKRYHTLCSRLGMTTDEKRQLLDSFGVESSLDLTASDLRKICEDLSTMLNPAKTVMDKWRKRVLASIGSWLRETGRAENAEHIKAIACRATGYEQFNKIPKQRLANLYYAFVKKTKDLKAVGVITAEELDYLAWNN